MNDVTLIYLGEELKCFYLGRPGYEYVFDLIQGPALVMAKNWNPQTLPEGFTFEEGDADDAIGRKAAFKIMDTLGDFTGPSRGTLRKGFYRGNEDIFLPCETGSYGRRNWIDSWLHSQKIRYLEERGVIFKLPQTTLLDWDTVIGAGSEVWGGVNLKGKVRIGKRCILESGVSISNCTIGDDCRIKNYSYMEDSTIGCATQVGPFAHLRPQTKLGDEVKVGNFVEVKKSSLEKGVKVSHLSYIGDAKIGAYTNVGCGFVTCNYDGKNKHQTVIGEKNFIGSHSQMVAPVKTGDNCFIAAGTTLTDSLEDGDFAISRKRQDIKKGLAKKFLKDK